MSRFLSVNLKTIIAALISVLLVACGGDKQGVSAPNSAAHSAPAAESVEKQVTQAIASTVDATAVSDEIKTIYQRSCISCHLSGAAGAPKTHDVAAWAPKMEKGMEAVIANIKNGLNAMPPKGLCFDCSDEQYEALVNFMAGPKS
ncbi:MAG: cytochrome c5 family protein [Pseudomonadales bacterium]